MVNVNNWTIVVGISLRSSGRLNRPDTSQTLKRGLNEALTGRGLSCAVFQLPAADLPRQAQPKVDQQLDAINYWTMILVK